MYGVIITDAGGCATEKIVLINSPDREVWTMGGNNLADSNKFIGTTNAYDLTFKANNTPRLKLLATGGTEFYGGIFTNQIKLGTSSNSSNLVERTMIGNTELFSFGGLSSSVYRAGSIAEPIPLIHSIKKGREDIFCESSTVNDGLFLRIGSDCVQGQIDFYKYENNIYKNDRPLMINYYSGNDVAICTNTSPTVNQGTVSTGRFFEVGFPYLKAKDSGIAAHIAGKSISPLMLTAETEVGGMPPEFNAQLNIDNISTKFISGWIKNSNNDGEIFSLQGNGELRIGAAGSQPSFFISPSFTGINFQTANVGIGTDNPTARLDVKGSIKSSSLSGN